MCRPQGLCKVDQEALRRRQVEEAWESEPQAGGTVCAKALCCAWGPQLLCAPARSVAITAPEECSSEHPCPSDSVLGSSLLLAAHGLLLISSTLELQLLLGSQASPSIPTLGESLADEETQDSRWSMHQKSTHHRCS